MKNKLAIIALLSLSAPLFAVISDAEYAQVVQEELQQYQSQTNLTHRKIRGHIASDPLFHFAAAGNLPVVEYLIEVKHQDPNKTVSENGVEMTPFDLARIYGHKDVADYLELYTRKAKAKL